MIDAIHTQAGLYFRANQLSHGEAHDGAQAEKFAGNAVKKSPLTAFPTQGVHNTSFIQADTFPALLRAQESRNGGMGNDDKNSIMRDVASRYDLRNITAKDTAQLSQGLYDGGAISLKHHAFLSFQPALNPEYNDTIGSISGVTLTGDEPKDLVAFWENDLAYKQGSGASELIINNTREIVDLVRKLDSLSKSGVRSG